MPSYKQNNNGSDKWLPKITTDYLKVGSAQGNRNNEVFKHAEQFRDSGFTLNEAKSQIWPRAELDGLSQGETFRAIESAYSRPPRPPAWGTRRGGGAVASSAAAAPATNGGTAPSTLPDPIPDGFAKLLNAAFEADEYVAISEAKPDGAGN